MARVNVDQFALIDTRFHRLGRLLGVSRWEAIGRMVAVWNYCTERQRDVLTDEDLLDLHPDMPSLATHIVGSDLGEQASAGIRIRGVHERMGWLGKLRSSGEAGGKARAAKLTPEERTASAKKAAAARWSDDAKPMRSDMRSECVPNACAPALALAPALKEKRKRAEMPQPPEGRSKFAEAWSRWMEYRTQIRKPLTPMSAKLQIGKLEPLPDEAVAQVIDTSIANGWQGLFPERAQPAAAATPARNLLLPPRPATEGCDERGWAIDFTPAGTGTAR